MTDVVFRRASKDDRHSILDLFWQISPVGRNVAYWEWLNLNGPWGPSLVEIVERDNMPIGHYAVMPVELRRGGEAITAGFAMQVGTHRSHRGLPNLRHMCDRVWSGCADAGMQFIYGFPNRHIWPIYKRMMNWQLIEQFRALEYPFGDRGNPSIDRPTHLTIKRLTRFEDRFDSVWEGSTQASAQIFSLPRTARYLNWRFFDHPAQHYKVLGAWDGSEPVGYAVLKFYHDGTRFIGHIADILTQKADAGAIASGLLAAAFDAFSWQQVDSVSLWMSPADPIRPQIDALGFTESGFESTMGLRPLGQPIPDTALTLAGWNLTMADSDAF